MSSVLDGKRGKREMRRLAIALLSVEKETVPPPMKRKPRAVEMAMWFPYVRLPAPPPPRRCRRLLRVR